MEIDLSDSVQRKNALALLQDAVARGLRMVSFAVELNNDNYVDLCYRLLEAAENQLDLAEAMIARFKQHERVN